MTTVCTIRNLKMQVPDGQGGLRLILDVAQVDIQAGCLTAISGASGSGKTTLLHCLTGIHRPSNGTINMQNVQLGALSEADRDAWRRTHVGLMFQDFQLVPEMTALANVLLPTQFARTSIDAGRGRELLNKYGIAVHHIPILRMSRGEQQRVAFARALLFNPPFVVADEPTASLDRVNAATVIEALLRYAAAGQTVIVATHDPNILNIAHHIIALDHGRIVRPHEVAQL